MWCHSVSGLERQCWTLLHQGSSAQQHRKSGHKHHAVPLGFQDTSARFDCESSQASITPALSTVSARPLAQFSSRHSGRSRGPGVELAASSRRAALPDIPVPEIGEDLRYLQEEAGAHFSDAGVALTYGREQDAAEAVSGGAALIDQSHWGRLRVTGQDALKFLHGQSTNDFVSLHPGQGRHTVFVTAQARTIELATCYALQPASVMVIVPSDAVSQLLERLNKYIFFGDQVSVNDASEQCCQLALMGPNSKSILKQLGVPSELLRGQPHAHGLLDLNGQPVLVAVGCSLHHTGYTLIADESNAGDLWKSLVAKGAVPMGEDQWEHERVLSGRPRAGRELTDAHTPLEAGLWSCVDLAKGCYIGQETLAKVSKLGALNRELWGIRLQAAVDPGDAVHAEGRSIGEVTSVTESASDAWFALAYLRCKSQGQHRDLEGVQVEINSAQGTVTAIPFASRSFPVDQAPQEHQPVSAIKPSAALSGAAAGPAAAPAGAKAPSEEQQRKLQAMQERLKQWQEQQQ